MRNTSNSVKRTAGALALALSVVSAVFGLTACGTHGGGGFRGGGGGFRGGGGDTAYSAPLRANHIVK